MPWRGVAFMGSSGALARHRLPSLDMAGCARPGQRVDTRAAAGGSPRARAAAHHHAHAQALLGKGTRDQMVKWLAGVLEGNGERNKMQPDYMKTASHGFFMNLDAGVFDCRQLAG
jgi:hypothetical protein